MILITKNFLKNLTYQVLLSSVSLDVLTHLSYLFFWFLRGLYSTMSDQWKIRHFDLCKFYRKVAEVFGSFFNDELDSGAFIKTSFKLWVHWLSKYLKDSEFMHWLYLSSKLDSHLPNKICFICIIESP